MIKQENVAKILKRKIPYLENNYGVKKIGIFGSFAKGIEKEDSDVDILVELKKPIGLKFIELAEHIEKFLGRKIDILTPVGINSIRIKQITKNITKKVIYV